MTTVINIFVDLYETIQATEDPRTQNWFLIGSSWPLSPQILLVIGAYLLFVNKIGPSFMAKRKPMNLDRIMQIYDVLQILANAFIFYKACTLGWLTHYNYRCQPVDRSNNPEALDMAWCSYLYLLLKISDFLDTVFFILRKKFNQASFLHIYHHTGVVVASFVCVKYLPGGHGTFLGFLNSFIHMIMYSHYLITSLKIYKPWWKKYITQLQLIQFFLITIHFSQIFYRDCDFPIWPMLIYLPQNFFMMVLFADFYYQTYIKKKPIKKNDQAKSKTQ